VEKPVITAHQIGPASQVQPQARAKAAGAAAGQPSFSDVLSKVVGEVDGLQKEADLSVRDFAGGKVDNVHEVVIAMEKAELSFKFMMEARNKLVDAYREVMRMQV